MGNRLGLLCAAAVLVAATPGFAAGKPAPVGPAKPEAFQVPRNKWGHPQLGGFWNNSFITTLERPAQYGDRALFTPEEVAKLEGAEIQFYKDKAQPVDPTLNSSDLLAMDCGKGFKGTGCGYDAGWIDPGVRVARVHGEPRDSVVTSTPNGRVPALTPEGQKRLTASRARMIQDKVDNPEDRPLGERCLTSWANHAGPVMMPSIYNNNYEIVQSKDDIALVSEVIHDARIIHMNAPHGPKELAPWYGDSIGHWDGDTLIIETINYNPNQTFRGASADLKVTEKITRVAKNRLLYQFTVEDPVYEYACHEGNYALGNMLAGARAEDVAKTASLAATVASTARP
jgi:hypothetical protein